MLIQANPRTIFTSCLTLQFLFQINFFKFLLYKLVDEIGLDYSLPLFYLILFDYWIRAINATIAIVWGVFREVQSAFLSSNCRYYFNLKIRVFRVAEVVLKLFDIECWIVNILALQKDEAFTCYWMHEIELYLLRPIIKVNSLFLTSNRLCQLNACLGLIFFLLDTCKDVKCMRLQSNKIVNQFVLLHYEELISFVYLSQNCDDNLR